MLAYDLDRYAAPPEKRFSVDGDGFLVPDVTSSVVPVRQLPEISRNFGLLGAGGAGKTTTAAALAELEPHAEYVETPLESRDKLEKMIAQAVNAKKPLYFDALDEAVTRDPIIMRWLARELGRPEATDGFWRLSCRAAAWDPVFASSLPDFKTWKLLPLDRATAAAVVEEAVGSPEFDGTAFIEATAAAGLGRLSGCVSQLIAVARFWHARGVLPETATEAMEYEVAHLLQETNSQRLRDLPADRAMRIARRLAAFETFSGAQAFAISASDVPGTLTVDQLPSEAEPVEAARVIEPGDYREVLDTALFDTGPAGAVVFRHQSYVEYLTAVYLVARKLQRGQVPALLGVHSNGLLPTSRIGVAAWLGALQPGVIEELIHANAQMLASAGAVTELPSDAVRAAVVAALLDHAASGKIHTDWSVDPALLVHASLEAQLAQGLGVLERSEQLWWIARLVAAGRCTGLAAALAEAAVDTQWYAYARRAAVIAVGELGDDAIMAELALILEQDDGPNVQLRAAVIDVLYPALMSTQVLMAALRPQPERTGDYNYDRTLSGLADRIPPADLPIALDWLGHLDDKPTTRRYGQLVEGLLQKAWDHSDDPDIRRALAHLLASGGWRLLSGERLTLPWREGEVDRRRSLVLETAAVQADSWMAIVLADLLRSDDLEWILDEIDTCPQPIAASLAECLTRSSFDEVTAALADRVLSLQPGHPAYNATQSLRGSEDMSSGIPSLRHKNAVATHEAARARALLQEDAKRALTDALAHIDMDPGSWWQIPEVVQQANDVDAAPRGLHDLTAWPGWSDLPPEDAAKLIDTGIRYLKMHTPNPAAWTSLTQWTSDQVMPDWTGVYLLTTLVRHYPEKLAEVQSDDWRRWLRAIIAVPIFTGDNPDSLRELLLDAVPAELWPVLADEAMNHLKVLHTADEHLSPVDCYRHLLQAFADRMVAWLLAVTVNSSKAADELLSLVVRSSPSATALDLCHRLRNMPDSPLAARASDLFPELDPNSAIEELTSADHTPAQIAAVASRINAARLGPDQVLSAARLLLDTFPYHDEPPTQGGAVTPEHTARQLRSTLLQQLASAGRADDLFALLANREDEDQQVLGQYLATARARQADLAVTIINPQSVLDLLRSADTRLVRDDADFLTVILHQLDHLQHQITHSTAFREIWDGDVPQSEDSITDWVQRRLEERLAAGVVVDREVQVKREKPQGVGTRIDCVATAFTEAKSIARVLFEAKLANNNEVPTAMRKQLIDRYLIPQGRCHGILLVYWIHPDRRPGKGWSKALHANKETLRATLQEQANAEVKNGFHIVPVILDITPPEGFAGKERSNPKDDDTTAAKLAEPEDR